MFASVYNSLRRVLGGEDLDALFAAREDEARMLALRRVLTTVPAVGAMVAAVNAAEGADARSAAAATHRAVLESLLAAPAIAPNRATTRAAREDRADAEHPRLALAPHLGPVVGAAAAVVEACRLDDPPAKPRGGVEEGEEEEAAARAVIFKAARLDAFKDAERNLAPLALLCAVHGVLAACLVVDGNVAHPAELRDRVRPWCGDGPLPAPPTEAGASAVRVAYSAAEELARTGLWTPFSSGDSGPPAAVVPLVDAFRFALARAADALAATLERVEADNDEFLRKALYCLPTGK